MVTPFEAPRHRTARPDGALTERLGPVTRIGLASGAWDEMPTRMTVDDRVVHIDAFSLGDDTALVTRGDQDYFSLLVVPPDTPPEAARAAMAEAVRADNPKQAVQILIDTSTGQARPTQPGAVDDHRREGR